MLWASRLAQDVQVDGRVLDQGQQAAVDVLDDHPLLGLALPAALHQQVHLLRTGARPLQLPALSDALDGLKPSMKADQQDIQFIRASKYSYQTHTFLHPHNLLLYLTTAPSVCLCVALLALSS